MKTGPAARYFEDLAPGDSFETQGRTVGEVETTVWAMFTGDMNPMHVDDVHAREHGLYDGRFPAGLGIVGIASGLIERLGLFAGTGLAMIDQTIRYKKAVRIGDTVHVRLTVAQCTPSRSRPAGRVRFDYEIVKHDDEVCIAGEMTFLLASRSAG